MLAAVAILACSACDPLIRKFEVVPQQLQCPGNVTLTWKGDADGLDLDADKPVSPATPQSLLKEGTQKEMVSETTTFMVHYPGAGHREKTVTVANLNCGNPVPMPQQCSPVPLTFNGQCTNATMGPSYDTQAISAAAGPGAITMLSNTASFPVHVQHNGQEIALGAGGGPLSPIPPNLPAAGSYTIIVPGQAGLLICQGAGPTSGTTDAPPVTVLVTPTCPNP